MLHLTLERHWTACGERDWSWALLAAERQRLDGATQRCGWPGCPGAAMQFDPVALLRHARHAHGGDIDDDLLGWAGGRRCSDCGQPFPLRSFASHLVRDPVDGVRRCPSLLRRVGRGMEVTDDMRAFVRSLTPNQVYVQRSASCDCVPVGARGDYGAIVGALMDECVRLADAGGDGKYAEAWRLLHVVLDVLHRPFGAQVGPEGVDGRAVSAFVCGGAAGVMGGADLPASSAESALGRRG